MQRIGLAPAAGGAEAATGLIEFSAEGPVPRRVRAARVVLVGEGEDAERTLADEFLLVLVRE